MSEHTYFVITCLNSVFDENLNMWYIDLPHFFTTSIHDEKYIKLLGFQYFDSNGNLDPTKTLHSETLCDGNYSQLNYFITMAMYTSTGWSKEYKITTKPQRLYFQFRSYSESIIKSSNCDEENIQPHERFVIETELIY